MNSYFLPLGLVLAFAAAWFYPQFGQALEQMGLIPWMVVIIFLVNGYQTRLRHIPRQKSLLVTGLIAIVINLLIAPGLALATLSLIELPEGAALGLVVMASMPATLSSGIVMTRLAGGDGVKALALTILLNLLGVFTVPVMLQLILENVGIIAISPWPLLTQLMQIVLLPFVIGMFIRISDLFHPHEIVLKYLPSLCVISTVWMSMSASAETMKEINISLLLQIVLCASVVHGGLLLLCWISRYLHRTERGELLALLFTASQKTLPVAVGVLAALDYPAGLALVACILFHFVQLFIDAFLASRLARV